VRKLSGFKQKLIEFVRKPGKFAHELVGFAHEKIVFTPEQSALMRKPARPAVNFISLPPRRLVSLRWLCFDELL
jgi:hypothetical protein